MDKKQLVRNKRGQLVRMSDAALRIAERHFGVNPPQPAIKEAPLELLNLQKKIEIIRAVQPAIIPLPKAEIIVPVVSEKKIPSADEEKKIPSKRKKNEGTKVKKIS